MVRTNVKLINYMVLIFSESNDLSTVNVIDWLHFRYKKEILRINTDIQTDISINSCDNSLNEICINIKNTCFSLESFISVWFRRGVLTFHSKTLENTSSILESQINRFLKVENQVISEYCNYKLTQKLKIGGFTQDVNKLHILSVAKDIGLLIPESIVTTSKEILEKFLQKHKKIITKPLYTLSLKTDEQYILAYTSRIDRKVIRYLPKTFFPSFFQIEIIKKYEIRTFYLRGEFYSMAIFSQNDKQTEVDFRIYNKSKPNRNVPYKLPKSIEFQLDALMKKISLDNGSIDLILDNYGKYHFLEINPVGQFGMVSIPCNYYIEKKIAHYLST